MAIARADEKPQAAIQTGGAIEVAHDMSDVIKAAGHREALHQPALLDRSANERRK